MLLVSDGKTTGVSGTFPFPYIALTKIRFFDITRRKNTALILIALEIFLCCSFVYLIVTNTKVTSFTAFSIGYPCLLINFKLLIQKNVTMDSKKVKVVGIAPKVIWIEHYLSCLSLGLSGLWANKMQDFDLLAPNIFSLIVLISIISAFWPLINLAAFRNKYEV